MKEKQPAKLHKLTLASMIESWNSSGGPGSISTRSHPRCMTQVLSWWRMNHMGVRCYKRRMWTRDNLLGSFSITTPWDIPTIETVELLERL